MTPEQLDAIRNRATRPRRTVPVVLDGDLSQQIQELIAEREAIDEATAKPTGGRRLSTRAASASRLAEIDAELDVHYAAAAASTLQVVIEGLAGTPYDAFRSQYPPRDGETADKFWRFNTEDGCGPLIRACAIGYRDDDAETVHPWSEGQLDWLLGFVTDWQRDLLFLAALNTCRGDDAVPLRPGRSATATSDAG